MCNVYPVGACVKQIIFWFVPLPNALFIGIPEMVNMEIFSTYRNCNMHIECYGMWVHNTPVLNGLTCEHMQIDCILPFLDDTSRQLTAMKILAECLGKGKQPLCYLYEEYSVCFVIRHEFEYLFLYSFTGQ